MKSNAHNAFFPLQLSVLHTAVQARSRTLASATKAAPVGSATGRDQDSAAALALDADRYEALAAKLLGASPLTRDDLEHALVAASIARRAKARSTDRAAAVVLNGLVATLTDVLADEALVHDEY